MTKQAYLRSEAARVGVAVDWFAKNGVRVEPCDHKHDGRATCPVADCPGWRMVS